MKWLRFFLLLCFALFPTLLCAEKTLNVYNWANYMPREILHQFEQETGIHINYNEFDSNEIMYAKLKSNPNSGYDIIVPSSYYVPRMARDHLLQRLDLRRIPNSKYLKKILLGREYDPHNDYSLPYTWGVTGIAVNQRYFSPKDFKHWQDLWNPRYKNQLLLIDDMREVFSIALITLGYSVNDTDPEHIKQAYEKLRLLLPNIKLFNSDAEQNIYVDTDATLGIAWNGDIYQVQQENPDVQFVYPENQFVLWIDCVCIMARAPHLNSAYIFLNFINRPDIAAKIADFNGYSSPNAAAIQLMPKATQLDPTFNPPATVLRRAVMEIDLGKATAIYEKYWELLKLGG